MADNNGYPPPERDERRGREDRDRDRDRDREHRDRDRDRRGRDDEDRRRRGGSRERRRSRSRSRSRTPPRRRRPRKTQWDVLPDGTTATAPAVPGLGAIPGMPGIPGIAALPGLAAIPGITAPVLPVPALAPTLPVAAMAAVGNIAGLGVAAGSTHTQQATRHARRCYVGGLPPTANEQSVATFFAHALAAVGGNTAGPGTSVVNVYLNKDKNFAFVEFRTVEETSNAMALDGIMFEGVSVRVRRPNDYNPTAAAALGPATPSPSLNLAAIGLAVAGGGPTDAQERIFVGGLPYDLTDEQCREILQAYGPIKSFDLVKDRETGRSKGYGFAVYVDPSITDMACAGLNGLQMGDRTLTVRRATEGATRPDALGMVGASLPSVVPLGIPGLSIPGLVPGLANASRIVILENAVQRSELEDAEEYAGIVEDMEDECQKYGTLVKVTIPRPTPEQPEPSGLGKVVIEFADAGAAIKARNAMQGRKFAGHVVQADFLTEEQYATGMFG